MALSIAISCKTTQLPYEKVAINSNKMDDCLDINDKCLYQLAKTTRQLEETNELLKNYKGIETEEKIKWAAIGLGAGAGAILIIFLGLFIAK